MAHKYKYTDKELTYAYLRDLIVDIRCAIRDGLPEYAEQCKRELIKLYAQRHRARIGRYGAPIVD